MPGTPNRAGHFAAGTDTTQADGLPQMPPGISAPAAVKWEQLLDRLSMPALRTIDCHELRILCELLAVVDGQTTTAVANPTGPKLTRIMLKTAQQSHRLSAFFGLTPSDRSRLHLPEDAGPDELHLWLAVAKARATLGPRPHRTTCGADTGHTGLPKVGQAAALRGGDRYSPLARSLSRSD